MQFEQLAEPIYKRYKIGAGYRVDVNTPLGPSYFLFHNRKGIPQTASLDENNLNAILPSNSILDYGSIQTGNNKVHGYEIIEHNEIVLLLASLQSEGLDLSRTIIWNFDNHHDMHRPFNLLRGIWIDNWVCAAKAFNMFNNQDRRQIHKDLGMGLMFVRPPGFDYRIRNQNIVYDPDWWTDRPAEIGTDVGREPTGVRVSLPTLDDHFLSNKVRRRLLIPKPDYVVSHIDAAKKNGFNIIVSFDLDIGNTSAAFARESYSEDRWDPHRERFAMFNNPLIRLLCANSVAVIVCHSPGYAPTEYAHREAVLAREAHLEGYKVEES